MRPGEPLWGLLAEFNSPDRLIAAARRLRAEGYEDLEAFTPFPVEGVPEALGFEERWIPFLALAGFLVFGAGMFGLQTWMNAINYPLNIGGRPLFAWPAFLVPAYMTAILGAVLFALGGMLWRSGLPRLHHPVFGAARFRRVTTDRFFLAVRSEDPRFIPERTEALLREVGALGVDEVPA